MRRRAAYVAVAVLAAGLAACAGDPAPPEVTRAPESTPSTRASSATADASYSDWEVGAEPLPLRPDGFGKVRRTPAELRERRLPTEDLLPPPEDGRFHATIGPITDDIRRRMGETWSPRCPVARDGLRYVTVSFRGFDGEAHTGELVVAAAEADEIVSVFEALYSAGFPIEEMRLPTTADLEAHPTGDGNNTAATVCRSARGQSSWSAHAYGLAVDVNPFQNPYQRGDLVLPELASSYLDRSRERPGMILDDSVVAREFARIGWSWGGDWTSLKDYQHFSATGH